MIKKSLTILFLISTSLLYAQESKDIKPDKWRLNLSGGYAYLLGNTNKAERELAQSLIDPSVANDYYSKIKFGPQANADVHYFFRPNMGLGICYTFFTTSPSEKNVIKTPNLSTGDDLLPLITLSSSSYMFGWIDHCEQTNSLWVTPLPDSWWVPVREVVCFKGLDYEASKSILPSDYLTTINGKQDYYQTCVHYVFSNKSGTCVYFVRNIKNISSSGDNTDYNAWSIETVKL